MSISKLYRTYAELFWAAIFLFTSFYIGRYTEKPFIFVPKQENSLNINNKFLTHFHMGLKRLISSSLWVATIIESDTENYKNDDLNSWMFIRFNTISILEPLFYENYAFAGPYLSIIKNDLQGASVLYDNGLAHYPDDFTLLRDSGFHYYFEVGDFVKAFASYSKLRYNPKASPLLLSILARLEMGRGNNEDAFNLLANQYEKIEDKNSFIAKKIFQNMYAIKAEQDINCLNSKESIAKQCNLKDYNGLLYIKEGQSYKAPVNWTPFRAKKRPVIKTGQ